MARVNFTDNLKRHIDTSAADVAGDTVRDVLEACFAANPRARDYVLDDQGAPRAHVAIFVNGALVRDRQGLSDHVGEHDEVFVMQALSGG